MKPTRLRPSQGGKFAAPVRPVGVENPHTAADLLLPHQRAVLAATKPIVHIDIAFGVGAIALKEAIERIERFIEQPRMPKREPAARCLNDIGPHPRRMELRQFCQRPLNHDGACSADRPSEVDA